MAFAHKISAYQASGPSPPWLAGGLLQPTQYSTDRTAGATLASSALACIGRASVICTRSACLYAAFAMLDGAEACWAGEPPRRKWKKKQESTHAHRAATRCGDAMRYYTASQSRAYCLGTLSRLLVNCFRSRLGRASATTRGRGAAQLKQRPRRMAGRGTRQRSGQ